jgi:O-antigen/teichoic acid export membrane protein
VPGTTLLTIARALFDDGVLSAVVEPTIADLQREVAAAGSNRVRRLRAQWRGYGAFWRIALVVPFVSWALPARDAGPAALRDTVSRLAFGAVIVALLAAADLAFGAWVAAVTTMVVVVAILLHAWYDRHPSDLPDPAPQQRPPQINFSSTDVAGNIGGLIFAVGSVFIVAIALPSLILFLFAATVAGGVLAWALVAWRIRHPRWGLPENRIVLR